MADPTKRIVSAGTVVLRRTATNASEVLLVHREDYDDWSLPKGKLERGEYLAVCAVRETREETAAVVSLRLPAKSISYPVGGGVKTVHYWLGHLHEIHPHEPDDEIDDVGWFSITQALRQATYPDERDVLRHAVNLPDTTPLIIVRHAKALPRAAWERTEPDHKRVLDERGKRQSQALVPLLDAYGVTSVVSSSATRCVKTVRPFAKAHGFAVATYDELTEERGMTDPKTVSKVIRKLARVAAAEQQPTVVCGHRPVLPTMLEALGLPPRAMAPATALVVHLDKTGQPLAVEMHEPTG